LFSTPGYIFGHTEIEISHNIENYIVRTLGGSPLHLLI